MQNNYQNNRLRSIFLKILLQFANPLKSGFAAAICYLLLASVHETPWAPSNYPYFNYLADAFLHGQLYLRIQPPVPLDLVLYSGKYFLYWPPLPAVILIPLVALFGPNVSDIFFSVFIAGIDVYLVGLLLIKATEQNVIRLSDIQRAMLTFFFAFGTVFMTLAPLTSAWYTSQLVSIFFVLLTFIAAITASGWKAFLLTGIAVAGALATRNNLLFVGIWPGIYLIIKYWKLPRLIKVRNFIIGVIPIVFIVLLLALYNWARFGNPLDVGLQYHQMSSVFVNDFLRYGVFNIHYIPTNIYYQYIYYPFPYRPDFFMGGSLFLLSPLLFASFWGITSKYPLWSRITLLISIFLINIPILLLMGTGWIQFGPRYTLDFSIPLLLLTAMGMERWKNTTSSLTIMISVVHYLAGTLIFLRAV